MADRHHAGPPNQMFTDGFGEMTAEDVKFSFERFLTAGPDGRQSPYKADWSGLWACGS
jgi:peptide/nickel transport system substrate-binding protein